MRPPHRQPHPAALHGKLDCSTPAPRPTAPTRIVPHILIAPKGLKPTIPPLAGSRILQRYTESRRLERVVRDITSRRRGQGAQGAGQAAAAAGVSGVALPFGVGAAAQQQQQDAGTDHRWALRGTRCRVWGVRVPTVFR